MRRIISKINPAKTAICFLIVLLLLACSKNENDYYEVKVDKTTVVLTNEVDSQTFDITSKGDWHIEAKGLQSGYGTIIGTADWYIVDRIWGNGNATVVITLKEKQPEDHSAILTIIGKHNRVNINLKQQIMSD